MAARTGTRKVARKRAKKVVAHDDAKHPHAVEVAADHDASLAQGGPPGSLASQVRKRPPGSTTSMVRVWTEPVTFPGADNPAQLRESFRAVNAWARELKEWNISVQTVFLMMEVQGGIRMDHFMALRPHVASGDHTPATAMKVMGMKPPKGPFVPASDIVGHPPDPPFSDPILPDP